MMVNMPAGVQTWMEAGYFAPLFGPREPRLFVVSHGDKKTARETVLLLPGVAASSFSFSALAPALANEGLRTVSFDYPGRGLSEHNGNFEDTPSGRAKMIRTIARSLGLQHIHVVMHGTACFDGAKAFSGVSMIDVRSFVCIGPVEGVTSSPLSSASGRLLCQLYQLPTVGSFCADALAAAVGQWDNEFGECLLPCRVRVTARLIFYGPTVMFSQCSSYGNAFIYLDLPTLAVLIVSSVCRILDVHREAVQLLPWWYYLRWCSTRHNAVY